MLNNETQRHIISLRLIEIFDILEIQNRLPEYMSMSFEERLEHLINEIYIRKTQSKIDRLIKEAKFRYQNADCNDIQCPSGRSIDMTTINNLKSGNFIQYHTNICIYGATGSGKTWIANAIGRQICFHCKRVKYIRLPDLITDFDILTTDKEKKSFINKISNYDLLIIDEWVKDPLTDANIGFIFEVIERRYRNYSTIFCSQYSPNDWYSRMGGSTQSEAVLDRIVHTLCNIDCGNFNMRELLESPKI